MDEVTAEKLCDINEATMTYVNSVLKLSPKLPWDVTRPLFEKSYRMASVVPQCFDTSATPNPPFLLPEVCSRCYTPLCAGVLHSQLHRSFRNARSVRQLNVKKNSMLHKLSSRERMMIDSHDQWSNLLLTRCRVCSLKTRLLCPLPGQRPALSSRQPAMKPDILQLRAAMGKAVTPTHKKKKNKSKKSECGLIISEDLKQEIQMTMGVHGCSSTKNRRMKGSSQVVDSKSDACDAGGLTNPECREPSNLLSNDDSILKYGPGTLTFDSQDSTQIKMIGASTVVPNEAGKGKPIVASRSNETRKSKMAAKLEQESLQQAPPAGTKFVKKSSPNSKKVEVCDITTPSALKKRESDNVSMLDLDSKAPLLRINKIIKTQNVRQMQRKSNALKSAFKQSMPLKPSKSIKDFLNTLF